MPSFNVLLDFLQIDIITRLKFIRRGICKILYIRSFLLIKYNVKEKFIRRIRVSISLNVSKSATYCSLKTRTKIKNKREASR